MNQKLIRKFKLILQSKAVLIKIKTSTLSDQGLVISEVIRDILVFHLDHQVLVKDGNEEVAALKAARTQQGGTGLLENDLVLPTGTEKEVMSTNRGGITVTDIVQKEIETKRIVRIVVQVMSLNIVTIASKKKK